MVTIFSWALLLPVEDFREDFGVLLPKMAPVEDVLTDDGMDVLLRARDFAELRLADRDELLRFGVLGGTGPEVSFDLASDVDLRLSSPNWKLSQNCSDVSTTNFSGCSVRSSESRGDPENRCFFRDASGDGVDGVRDAGADVFGVIFPIEASPATSKAEMDERVDVFALVST